MTAKTRLAYLEKKINPKKPIKIFWESRTANDLPGVFHVDTESGPALTRDKIRELYQDTNTLLYVTYDKHPPIRE
jgi:hypothetical protein